MSRDRRQMHLGDFVAQMTDDFETTGRDQVKVRKGEPNGVSDAPPAGTASAEAPKAAPAPDSQKPLAAIKYADVSRGIQNILKERHEPITCEGLEDLFRQKFGTSIADVVGMSIGEYLQRKENIFDYNPNNGTVFLQSSILAGPPVADPNSVKDEHFVVREFEQLIESMGPVVYISTLCG